VSPILHLVGYKSGGCLTFRLNVSDLLRVRRIPSQVFSITPRSPAIMENKAGPSHCDFWIESRSLSSTKK